MTNAELMTTAELARLEIDGGGERERGAFEQMLDFFALMQEADTDRAAFGEPIDGLGRDALDLTGESFRPDDPACAGRYNPDGCLNESFIQSSGDHDGPFIVIPCIF